ncbi:MAG TPA: hypothetical protein VFO34_07535 [Candidatus Acidoferrales bacterium]|nr:hypothetical protein [Candidatus Acidoferrales bacterium]
MSQYNRLMEFAKRHETLAAAATAVTVFLGSSSADVILNFLRLSRAATISNDIAVGALAGACVFLYSRAAKERDRFERYKERIALMTQVDRHVRKSLTQIAESALTEDRELRIRRIDDAVERFDDMVMQLIAAVPQTQ